jgi:hypothetical protein
MFIFFPSLFCFPKLKEKLALRDHHAVCVTAILTYEPADWFSQVGMNVMPLQAIWTLYFLISHYE